MNIKPDRQLIGTLNLKGGGKMSDNRTRKQWRTRTMAAISWMVVALFWLVLSSSEAAGQTHSLCTPGTRQCQVNNVAVCECEEIVRSTDDGSSRIVVLCGWRQTSESCGVVTIPPCTQGYEGATYRFPDGTKTCTCDQAGETQRCRWRY